MSTHRQSSVSQSSSSSSSSSSFCHHLPHHFPHPSPPLLTQYYVPIPNPIPKSHLSIPLLVSNRSSSHLCLDTSHCDQCLDSNSLHPNSNQTKSNLICFNSIACRLPSRSFFAWTCLLASVAFCSIVLLFLIFSPELGNRLRLINENTSKLQFYQFKPQSPIINQTFQTNTSFVLNRSSTKSQSTKSPFFTFSTFSNQINNSISSSSSTTTTTTSIPTIRTTTIWTTSPSTTTKRTLTSHSPSSFSGKLFDFNIPDTIQNRTNKLNITFLPSSSTTSPSPSSSSSSLLDLSITISTTPTTSSSTNRPQILLTSTLSSTTTSTSSSSSSSFDDQQMKTLSEFSHLPAIKDNQTNLHALNRFDQVSKQTNQSLSIDRLSFSIQNSTSTRQSTNFLISKSLHNQSSSISSSSSSSSSSFPNAKQQSIPISSWTASRQSFDTSHSSAFPNTFSTTTSGSTFSIDRSKLDLETKRRENKGKEEEKEKEEEGEGEHSWSVHVPTPPTPSSTAVPTTMSLTASPHLPHLIRQMSSRYQASKLDKIKSSSAASLSINSPSFDSQSVRQTKCPFSCGSSYRFFNILNRV